MLLSHWFNYASKLAHVVSVFSLAFASGAHKFLRVEQQHYTLGAFAIGDIAVTILQAADIFGHLSYKGFFTRRCVSRSSQRICLCVVRNCSIMISTLQSSLELGASINDPSQLPVEVSVLVSHLFDHGRILALPALFTVGAKRFRSAEVFFLLKQHHY